MALKYLSRERSGLAVKGLGNAIAENVKLAKLAATYLAYRDIFGAITVNFGSDAIPDFAVQMANSQLIRRR